MDKVVPSAVDETTIVPDEALARLAHLEAPHTPIFHECGIVDAGVGYYHVARLGDKLLLRFAFDLEDFQLKEYPGLGKLFAHPGAPYEVNAYEKTAPASQIYADLIAHQAAVMQVMREEYTLVRIAPDVYCSRAIAYALRRHKHAAKDGAPKEEVGIDAFVNSLHDKGYTPAAVETDGSLYDRIRVSRVPISDEHVKPEEAVYTILGHFTSHLDKLMRDEEGLDGNGVKLNPVTHTALRLRRYGVRLFDKLATWGREKTQELRKQPLGLIDLAERASAVAELLNPEGNAIQLIGSFWDAFGFEPKVKEENIPELLRPYVSPNANLPGQLASHMYPTNTAATELAVPLTMAEAGIAPSDVDIIPGSPFDVTKDRAPGIGALRAPLGTILHAYRDTTLLMQANGVWMAMQHETDKLYVGYNADMDADTKPYPSPILKAWLEAGKVLCYSCDCRGRACKPVSMAWEEAAKDLQDIIASGEGHLLATHTPKHDAGPLVIPGHAPLNQLFPGSFLNFSEAFEEYDRRQKEFGIKTDPAPPVAATVAAAVAALVAPSAEEPHLAIVKPFPKRPAQQPGVLLAPPSSYRAAPPAAPRAA